MSKADLKLDWCSHSAAKYAVEKWHYSRRMPIGKLVKVGVWECSQFIGCVLYARGNTPTLGDRYGLSILEVCELVRVALREHVSPVSRIIALSLRMIKRFCNGLRLVVSFADPTQGHLGSIYQAGGWIYTGESEPSWQWLHDGRWKHNREITSGAFGGKRKVQNYSDLPKRQMPGKHRYLYPLDAEMRARILPLAKPYPKRATSISNAPVDQTGDSGSRPTVALHPHARTGVD